jgi:serine phosphatase RsbU (regulator of sigma subunit)
MTGLDQAGGTGGQSALRRQSTTTVEVAARSMPFDGTSELSGDWNDILELASGDIVVIVGDAVGRGRRAAPLRVRLQPQARGMARAGARPAEIVDRLHTVGAGIDSDSDIFATVICAAISPSRLELCHANAGHPPPLLICRNGATRFIGIPVGPPIGAPVPAGRPLEVVTPIRPGDTLVLYTDGLVEDQHRSIDDGLARIAATAADAAAATSQVGGLCDRLMELGIHDGRPSDDLTVVAARMGQDGRANTEARLLALRPGGHRDHQPKRKGANHAHALRPVS